MIKRFWKRLFGKKTPLISKQEINAPKVAQNKIELPDFKSKQTKRKSLLYSNDFKTFVKQNKGALSRAFELINELENSKKTKITDSVTNLKITQGLATGHSLGRNQERLFKVETGNQIFFVKKNFNSCNVIKRINLIENELKKINHQIDGVNIQLIKPYLVYNNWLITKFYTDKEVVQLFTTYRIPEKILSIQPKIKSMLRKIENKLKDANLKELDHFEGNRFYNSKTNTILLFDYL